jgi:phosphohistidine phosphatase
MDLFLLRHAIAEPAAQSGAGLDRERRLTPEGEEKMREIAEGMKACELEFDLILSSPYVRAKQSADIVAEVFHCKKRLELSPNLTPDGSPQKLIDELNSNHADKESILLAGHEPYLSGLLSLLISGDAGIAINFKKGGLGKLTVDRLRHGRCATLEWLLTPRQLRGLGQGKD